MHVHVICFAVVYLLVDVTSLSVTSANPLLSGVGLLHEPQEPWGYTLIQKFMDACCMYCDTNPNCITMSIYMCLPLLP